MNTLDPIHLDDLKKSGLSDDTITRCQFESVRPKDIPIKGVESAYRLPYFSLSGKREAFERFKLFPPLKTEHGTMKYWQPAGTSPSLYYPPGLDWLTIAQDVSRALYITEGEKKAASMSEDGRPCVGVAGVWNWRKRLTDGEAVPLPQFSALNMAARAVFIIPDSDVWDEKFEALCGFYAMAKSLVTMGASVIFLRLPTVHGGKCGVDDWRIHVSPYTQESYNDLTRLEFGDPSLDRADQWYGQWKEKHSTLAAIKEKDAEGLILSQDLDVYRVRSAPHGAVLEFERVGIVRGSPQAELTVTLGSTELYTCVDIGLKSEEKQARLAKSLHATAPHVPWKVLIHKACALVLKASRAGIPVVTLSADRPVEPLIYDVLPLVYRGKTTVLFGDGGLGKSTFGLFIGMAVSLGVPAIGMSCAKRKVLYLDYEDDETTHQRRLSALIAGHPSLQQAQVEYMKLTEPLWVQVHDILKRTITSGTQFIILDSVLCATGGDSSAESATKLNLAFRKLNCSILAIGHVAKGQNNPDQPQGGKTIYGSVFFQNLARSTFEVQTYQDTESDESTIALVHRKHNLSRAHPSIGLKMTQDPDTTQITYTPCNLDEVPELQRALDLSSQIRNLLEQSEPMHPPEIALELGVKESTIRSALSRGKKYDKWHQTGTDRGSPWTVYR